LPIAGADLLRVFHQAFSAALKRACLEMSVIRNDRDKVINGVFPDEFT
jgi:hypothetical protein